ncbi:hypothetical protein BDN72DRAFT_963061 [Pluteus cervinus]|uniref:Uncharacterized protein n=1 Tax=Pluteus cervinus TaxID=181527 RepID=A0ACD3AG53_9AGAR|nr:hypothetical protein BDN72DRAFT_963061 [Pluteus cervinus]
MDTQPAQTLHRRKSSTEDGENLVILTAPVDPETKPAPAQPSSRIRVNSNPMQPAGHARSPSSGSLLPPSAGPYRTSFGLSRSPIAPNGMNGMNGHYPASPLRSSFRISPTEPPTVNGHGRSQSVSQAHSRTRSISTPFSPALPSPLVNSSLVPHNHGGHGHTHGPEDHHSYASPPPIATSKSAPGDSTLPFHNDKTDYPIPPSLAPLDTSSGAPIDSGLPPSPTATRHGRRHSRLHSRNLSIFFPRPGSLPHSSIAEDGAQELELGGPVDEEAIPIPSAGPSVSIPSSRRKSAMAGGARTPLGAGFTFGGKPPGSTANDDQPPASATTRRGHHHKHSMSHNFFSFLEPGSNLEMGGEGESHLLHTQPTPSLVSPWQPISPLPRTPGEELTIPDGAVAHPPSPAPSNLSTVSTHSNSSSYMPALSASVSPSTLRVVSVLQFLLGSALWVMGQQNGSLSSTGLGYWVVFDALGVGIVGWSDYLGLGTDVITNAGPAVKRFYGNGRVETVFIFAQAVYLMFAAVYICKESVEHLLLSMGSSGGDSGHHHHHDIGIDFPWFLVLLASITTLTNALLYSNHSKLVNISGNRIPPTRTLIRSFTTPRSSSSHAPIHSPTPTTPLGLALTNPYVASPLFFCLCILSIAVFAEEGQHQYFDLSLATFITIVTGKVAYRACVVLGTVLLQTSPRRGLPNGRMENFLRAMRDIERHPLVMHLPAPHIWQLTPTHMAGSTSGFGKGYQEETLVVTLELHVRSDVGDDDVLELTRWAWEKCMSALNGGRNSSKLAMGAGAEVTVGIVRG